MKKIYLLLFLVLATVVLNAQNEKPYDERPTFPTNRDYFMLDVFGDVFFKKPENVTNTDFNRGANIYALTDIKLFSYDGPFSIAIGAGVGFHNFYSDSYLDYDTTSKLSSFIPFSDSIDVKNNKLTIAYIDIPIELRMRIKLESNNKYIKLGLGAKFGYNITSHIKYKGDDYIFNKQETLKYVRYNVENLNPFRYGITARVGYGIVSVSAFYSLSDFFTPDAGVSLSPLSIGITLTPF